MSPWSGLCGPDAFALAADALRGSRGVAATWPRTTRRDAGDDATAGPSLFSRLAAAGVAVERLGPEAGDDAIAAPVARERKRGGCGSRKRRKRRRAGNQREPRGCVDVG